MLLVAGTDFDVELKQLRATMKTIGQVLNLDGMRAEIADLGEQVAAPDLGDDQENATRVTGRLSAVQGQLEAVSQFLSGNPHRMKRLGRIHGADAPRALGKPARAIAHALVEHGVDAQRRS